MRAAGPRWWGTLLLLPTLLAVGWLMVRPLAPLLPELRPDQVDLLGTFVSFGLLLLVLPQRLRVSLGLQEPWRTLGVAGGGRAALQSFGRGVAVALLLLLLVTTALLLSGSARPGVVPSLGQIANALALLLGVGFAEELIFRGWLLEELTLLTDRRRAQGLQAVVFALVHPWMAAEGWGRGPLLAGLVLLGLVLALRRRRDGGLLWGAVGLHGGLVGGWFLLSQALLVADPGAPPWLSGPGQPANPVGSVTGLVTLAALAWAWGLSGRPGPGQADR
jgi:membrane protease YdiL (CAAX protease family)